jgi:hypothetical protein
MQYLAAVRELVHQIAHSALAWPLRPEHQHRHRAVSCTHDRSLSQPMLKSKQHRHIWFGSTIPKGGNSSHDSWRFPPVLPMQMRIPLSRRGWCRETVHGEPSTITDTQRGSSWIQCCGVGWGRAGTARSPARTGRVVFYRIARRGRPAWALQRCGGLGNAHRLQRVEVRRGERIAAAAEPRARRLRRMHTLVWLHH